MIQSGRETEVIQAPQNEIQGHVKTVSQSQAPNTITEVLAADFLQNMY